MTKEDILELAREQGLPETANEGIFIVNTDDLGRLLAAEREACAKVIEYECHDDMTRAEEAAAIRARGEK